MKPQLTHVLNNNFDLKYGDVTLFRYTYIPDIVQSEVPKPYFHPMRTLAGNLITNFRPHDHLWHHGLAMTQAVLSDQNFWGGPSYVHGEGYVRKENNGTQAHQHWVELRCDEDAIIFNERLQWITLAGAHWINESRKISVSEINSEAGYYTLDFEIDLENVSGQTLVFGSPTTEGRPLAGYGGLFWRGPRSFRDGQILAGNNLEGPDVMGQVAPWLAFIGKHDGNIEQSTILFIDHPDNVRYPNKWFIRNTPYACASFSFAFDEELDLPTNDTLHLKHKIVIANGAWSREQIEAYLG